MATITLEKMVEFVPGARKWLNEQKAIEDRDLASEAKRIAELKAAQEQAHLLLLRRKISAEQRATKLRDEFFRAQQELIKQELEINGFERACGFDLNRETARLYDANRVELAKFRERLSVEMERLDNGRRDKTLLRESSDPPVRLHDGRTVRPNYRNNHELIANRVGACRDAGLPAEQFATCSPSQFAAAVETLWNDLPSIELETK